MSTTSETIRIKTFAEHCIVALRLVKQSLPKEWKQTLAPYEEEIRNVALIEKVSNAEAVEIIISRLNTTIIDLNTLKVNHTFYLAAYCDML